MQRLGFIPDGECHFATEFFRANIIGFGRIHGINSRQIKFVVMSSDVIPELFVATTGDRIPCNYDAGLPERSPYLMLICLNRRVIDIIESSSPSVTTQLMWEVFVKAVRTWEIHAGRIPVEELVPIEAIHRLPCAKHVRRIVRERALAQKWSEADVRRQYDLAFVSLCISSTVLHVRQCIWANLQPREVASMIFGSRRHNWRSLMLPVQEVLVPAQPSNQHVF